MSAFNRGRSGPSKGTPANVQCQKCLKRGHYSYECKASSQERPYVSRPSRSQQLRNPKLMPKLTEATPSASEQKKGTADRLLAKDDDKGAGTTEMEMSDEFVNRPTSEGRRMSSTSSKSVSTISTRDSRSPPPRTKSRSPPPERQAPSYDRKHDRSGRDRGSDASLSRSPPPRRQRSFSRDSRSPPRRGDRRYRARDDKHRPSRNTRRERSPEPARRQSPPRDARASPKGSSRQDQGRQASPERGGDQQPTRVETPRERSMSPFSRRMALTREMASRK